MIAAAKPSDWAVLIYSSASADIARDAEASLREVVAAPHADAVSVGALLATPAGVVRYARGVQAVPPQDMSEPGTLRDFLEWGMEQFPARHYLVVVGGHGGSFLGTPTDVARHRLMSPEELSQALRESGMHPDVLLLNACLMQQVEVAAPLAGQASFLVASQAEEHAEGMPLGTLVERIRSDMGPAEVARCAVAAAQTTPSRTPAMSALDLQRMPAIVGALDRLGQAILEAPASYPAIRETIAKMPNYREGHPWDRPLTDAKDLEALVLALQADARLQATSIPAAAHGLDELLERCVIASTGPAHGLSAYLPDADLNIKPVQALHDRLLRQAPHWIEAIEAWSQS